MQSIKLIDAGLKPYGEVLQLQEQLFNANLQAKENNATTANTLILCQHYPVFTLGKSGKRENILVSDEEMNAEFYKINRGGDVTFHGPGQLVAYPIVDVDSLGIGLARYIELLEETIIHSLLPYKLHAERIKDAAGIWLRNNGNDRKICAIGVRASRHITMHGLAMNVNTDLSYFNKIVPCGLQDKGVTSLQKELGRLQDFDAYKQQFIKDFEKVFDVKVHQQ
ncbi:MAG: lipoyl(octanoyl) transferase LipB [Chitinophagales bacterium]